jgi:hypothetical protein
MMAGILSYCRRLLKPRLHKRFSVGSGTIVLLLPGNKKERKVQLIDISQGGAAFIYKGPPDELEESGMLKVLAAAPGLEKVYFDTVSDRPLSDPGESGEPYRRRGVKFKWMGVWEQAQLKSFINEVGAAIK